MKARAQMVAKYLITFLAVAGVHRWAPFGVRGDVACGAILTLITVTFGGVFGMAGWVIAIALSSWTNDLSPVLAFAVVFATGLQGAVAARNRRDNEKAGADLTHALLRTKEYSTRAAGEAAHYRDRFYALLEVAPVPMWISEQTGVIVYMNPAYRACNVLDSCEDGGLRRLLCDGTWRWFSVVETPYEIEGQKGVVGMATDVTAWKDAESELKELVQMRQNFLAIMSHELRTPLTAILGYAQLLEEGIPEPLTKANVETVGSIVAAATRLQETVDSVLLFNDLDRGQSRVVVERVALEDLVASIRVMVLPRAKERGLSFAIDTTYAPALITTDSLKLKHILASLISNAFKFTKAGTVTLRTRSEADSVCFDVADCGVGMTEQDRQRIFEPFFQVRHDMVREVGGMGLGLTVAHRMAALIGGSIDVESKQGAGSTFTLRIPK